MLSEFIGFGSLFLYASFCEWFLHRFLMHQPLWSYPFRSHALLHHGIFRSGPSYFLLPGQEQKNLTFAWWNAPLIIGLHAPALFLIQYLFEINIFFGVIAAVDRCYVLYEYLHLCLDLADERLRDRNA